MGSRELPVQAVPETQGGKKLKKKRETATTRAFNNDKLTADWGQNKKADEIMERGKERI